MSASAGRSEQPTARRAEVEADVVAAVERLLAGGSSYTDLAVERIANEAGLSRTAFYFYYRDKRDLLTRVTEGLANELEGEGDRWLSGDGPQSLRSSLQTLVGIYRRHAALLRAVVEMSAYDEEVAVHWRALIGRFVARTEARIEAERAAGRVSPSLPAGATAFALCWMTERACYESLVQGGAYADELADGFAAVWEGTIYGGG